MRNRSRRLPPTILILAVALVVGAMAAPIMPGIRAAGPAVPDVSGQWTWTESVIVTAPGGLVAGLFGVQMEGPVMHVRCETWGGLTMQQAGSSFSGDADQQWACETKGGQMAMSAPFPPTFAISGSIAGQAVHFTADVGQGVSCSYAGSLGVAGGVATSINATGGCDVPLPFHPNMDKSISFDATR